MAWKKVPQENVEAFAAALPPSAGVELKKMFGCPAGFVNGNMFCGAHQEDVLVRLDEAEREKALKRPGFKQFEPMGKPMREYVCVPPEKAADVAYLKRWVHEGSAVCVNAAPERKEAAKEKGQQGVKVSRRRGESLWGRD